MELHPDFRNKSESKSDSSLPNMFIFLSLAGAWTLFVFSAFQYQHLSWFSWLLGSRIAAVVLALALLAISYSTVRGSTYLPTLYLSFCIFIQTTHGFIESSNKTDFYGFSNLLFLVAAVTYRGTYQTWFRFWQPTLLIFQLVPIISKDASLRWPVGHFIDNYSLFIAALVIGNIIVRANASKYSALKANLVLKDLLLEQKTRVFEKQRDISNIASQVAHDIRSPLAALKSVEKDLSSLPEETRVLVRGALNRIKDIANNLLEQNRNAQDGLSAVSDVNSHRRAFETDQLPRELLPSLLDVIMSEKRLQYRSQIGVEIEAVLDKGSYGIFSKIEPVEFKRVISNLINNSVEALTDGKGRLVVELGRRDGFAAITVRDNGKGIPSDILPKLMQNGSSFGKKSGSGLGLYHAKKSLQSWGGDLEISSEVGVGTNVVMTLPLAEAPAWFVEKLILIPGQKIIVLDDDSSIHQIWLGRFESAGLKAEGIEVLHFSTPEKIQEDLDQNKSKKLTFLMDYELLGSQMTGLDVIESNQLGSQAILVTSRFEEPGIRERCQRLKTKLIPKGMVAFVPIEVAQGKVSFDGIVIDDDPLVHLTWQARAKEINKSIKSYSRAADFIHFSDQVDPETPVYIDSNLGPGVSGEEVAKTLNTKGFQNIFIASGYEPDQFEHLKFLKGVIGKTPPF